MSVKPMIYLLKAGNYFKIGVSVDPSKRIRTLQTGCPERISIVHQIICEDAYSLEFALHGLFQNQRTHGEWFSDIDEGDFIRAVELYPNYVADGIEYPFVRYFQDQCDASHRLWIDITRDGLIDPSNRHLLLKEGAFDAINSALKLISGVES